MEGQVVITNPKKDARIGTTMQHMRQCGNIGIVEKIIQYPATGEEHVFIMNHQTGLGCSDNTYQFKPV